MTNKSRSRCESHIVMIRIIADRILTPLRPDPNAAPLMCRTKLNKVRLRSASQSGATVDSDGVLASNLIREACGKQFSMKRVVQYTCR